MQQLTANTFPELPEKFSELADHLDYCIRRCYRTGASVEKSLNKGTQFHNHCDEVSKYFGEILAVTPFMEDSNDNVFESVLGANYSVLRTYGQFRIGGSRGLGDYHDIGLLCFENDPELAIALDLVYGVLNNESTVRTAMFVGDSKEDVIKLVNNHYLINGSFKEVAKLISSRVKKRSSNPKLSLYQLI